MAVIDWVISSVKNQPVTSFSVFVTLIITTLTNLGILKPMVFEIQTHSLSLLSTTVVSADVHRISLVSISIAVTMILLVVLLWRKRK